MSDVVRPKFPMLLMSIGVETSYLKLQEYLKYMLEAV